ncbi:MAG: hypothetical protein HDS51_08215 [Barnesiella sp.]|nr:hypothetical protein [Barnesiella sp.]
MKEFKKALKKGAVLRSDKNIYTIIEPEQQDGFGITYLATGEPLNPIVEPRPRHGLSQITSPLPLQRSAPVEPAPMKKYVIREHFMFHCSDRADDDKELAIDEYSESTVDDFQQVFRNTVECLKKATQGNEDFLQLVDDFEANGTYYYVTEYLEGPTLRKYIEENGAIPVRGARILLEPIFKAVRRFHTNRILHTGLSPDAIIIDRHADGTVRPVLTQLYSCKMFTPEGEGALQLPPLSCPDRYAPREQYGELDKFLPQTNLYSLGAILTYALTGEEPPLAEDVDEDIISSMLPDNIPESFRVATIKAMSPDWHDRYESVTVFNSALLSSIVTDDDRIRTEEHNAPAARRKRRLTRWIILGVIVSLLVALAIIISINI